MDTGPTPTVPTAANRRAVTETSVEELLAGSPIGWGAQGGAAVALAVADDGRQLDVSEPAAGPPADDADELIDADEAAGSDAPPRTRGRRSRSVPWAPQQPPGEAVAERAGRLRVMADTNGPKVRLGVAWFALASLAVLVSPFVAAGLFAVVAAVGAIQTAAALRRVGGRPQPWVAGAAAFVIVLSAAAPTSRAVGLTVLIAVVASMISALHVGGFDSAAAGATVRSWLAIALAAAAPVVFARAEVALAVLLLLLVSAYDAGDFLVGSAANNSIEGPLAGVVGALAVGCGAAVLHPGGLAGLSLWPAVVLAALACPLGQIVASATLPRAGSFAPALRRLDSLIVAGVLWMLLFS